MRHFHKVRPEIFVWRGHANDLFERLRFAAAARLCRWTEHAAGGGSTYIFVGDSLKIRFADHENTSTRYQAPDFNFVNRHPNEDELQDIIRRIAYPSVCRKTAFAMHVGLTVPKLKKLLAAQWCFEDVCENDAYPFTYTEYVSVDAAFDVLDEAGVTERIPIRQESFSVEDYSG